MVRAIASASYLNNLRINIPYVIVAGEMCGFRESRVRNSTTYYEISYLIGAMTFIDLLSLTLPFLPRVASCLLMASS